MEKILHWFVPKNRELFGLLSQQSSHALEAVKELKNLIAIYHDIERSERKANVRSIKYIEKKADVIKHRVIEMLDNGLQSATDKEGIRRISENLEEIVDLLNSVASKLVLLSIERIDTHIAKLIDLNVELVLEINKIILDLNKLKGIEDNYSRISGLENKIDDIYHEALSELYHFYKNSIDIIKYREIYELLENVADKCKDVANNAKSFISKNS